jgi:type I restriction enzyme S subunit
MLQSEPLAEGDIEAPYLKAQHVQWSGVTVNDLPTMWACRRELEKFRVSNGDLLVCEGGDVGRAAILKGIEYPTIIQNALHRVRSAGDADSRFLSYVLAHASSRGWFEILCNRATIAHFTGDKFGALEIPLPPPDEQRAISTFLDCKTARIDALIETKRRLIELLQEKRVAVIAQAVTRGLNAAAPLKDSGSSWIGQIPRHWEVCRVKLVARLESGHTPSRSVPEYWEDCDIPWVSLNDSKQLARSDYISETAVRINKRGLDNSSARILPTDAVVFTRDATIGLAAITTRPMAVSQHLIAWIPGPRINSRFLLRVFNAMKPFLDAYTFGATIKTIGMPDVKKLVTPVPPLAEQVAIADALDRATRCIDQAVEKTQAAIDRMSEYRSAIVTAAVTGQIDVREAA